MFGGWLATHPPSIDSGETAHWWPIIQSVARGQGYRACFPGYFPLCRSPNSVTASREPAPVLLFAATRDLLGESLLAAGTVEILLNLGILLAIFSLARRLAGPRVAVAAALLWILYLPALKLTPQVSGDLLATLGVTWGTYFFLRSLPAAAWSGGILSGALLGVGALSRSVVLVIALCFALGALIGIPRPLRRRVRFCTLFLLAFLLVLSPWAIRNYRAFGRPVIGTTLTGYNLYRQNYILVLDNYLRFVNGEEAAKSVTSLVGRTARLSGKENEAEMDALYGREALKIIRAEPARYGLLSAYRFLLLWFNWGYLKAYGARPRLADYSLMLEQGVLLGLALLGFLRLRRLAWPLMASAAALSVAYMAVISQLRFVVPVMPNVIVLAVVGASALRGGRRQAGQGQQ